MQRKESLQSYKIVKLSSGKTIKIPFDWNVVPLQNISKIIMGQSPPGKSYNQNAIGLPLLNGPADLGNKFPNPNSWTSEPTKVSEIGDIIIGIRATLGQINYSDKKYCLGRGVAAIRVKPKTDFNYVFNYCFKLKEMLTSISAGSVIKGIKKSDLELLKVVLPSQIKEQQKIASILSNVESLINSIQEINKQTQRLKKGLMQKLFTKGIGHAKFKKVKWYFGKEIEIPEEWKILELGHASKVIDSLHITPKYSSNGIPIIRSTDIKYGDLKLEKALRVTKEVYDDFTKNHKPKRNDIVMSRVGTYFVTSFVNTDEPFCMGQNTLVIHPKINPRFLYYSLNSIFVTKQIEFSFDRTSGQKTISLKNIRKLLIFYPTLVEQQKIASILSNVESTIQRQQEYKSNHINLKNGLMKKLFSGQIRVKV